jgi:hypothetical protein
MNEAPLKLRAQDAEDIQVIGAVLQDAIAPVCDMLFKPDEKNFVMVVHRFRWDQMKAEQKAFERVCCALDIHGVEAVQRQGFDQTELARMLDLLTMVVEEDSLHFIFAGGARLKLKLANWRMRLEDFGEPWPVSCQPRHAT